uniref:Uncharacterized protein LOC109505437 isoform X2 n=1 Tax=Elaeis guineensis var. tenera TaxID=51953 RepID=A0A6J0PEI2_ELAGV|nr:uncharacterized protein LOC109505437 isoform X2 [Elaeis guineensis]
MAKSLRSKKEKRLRTLRREIAEPFYNKKDAVKLAASKLPIRGLPAADEPSTAMASSEENEPRGGLRVKLMLLHS